MSSRLKFSSDTEAEIAFFEAAFGAKETPGSRMLGPDGRIGHVEAELGASSAPQGR
jgi:PhnB protein